MKECKECDPGCQYCDPEAAWVCLTCAGGLALLDGECRAECPDAYLKSPDGSTCEPRTYPLDATFIAFPVLGAAAFFVLITLASYWLTGHRSLVSSTLIAFFGPIEMAATLYQFLYTLLDDDRNFVPIRIGSICVFSCGVILNLVFIVHFHKQVKGTDKEFERWRKRKWCASNCCLFMAGGCSLTLYRLIYCRIFRLQAMSVKLSRPQPFLRPILMFTWIKFLVFNIPLIIVDLVGTAPLAWGNQCYMTMVESCVLSFCSLILMLWETVKRKDLIRRESRQLTLEKMEVLDEADVDGSYTKTPTYGGLGQVRPGGGGRTTGGGRTRGATPLRGPFDLVEQLGGTKKGPASPRTLKLRVEQLQNVIAVAKRLRGVGLNEGLDEVLDL